MPGYRIPDETPREIVPFLTFNRITYRFTPNSPRFLPPFEHLENISPIIFPDIVAIERLSLLNDLLSNELRIVGIFKRQRVEAKGRGKKSISDP